MRVRHWLPAALLLAACSVELAPLEQHGSGGSGDGTSGGAGGASGGAAGSDFGGSGGTSFGGASGAAGGGASGASGGTGGVSGASGSGASGGVLSGGSGGTGATSGTGATGGGGGPTFTCVNLATLDTGGPPCDNINQQFCYCFGCYSDCVDPVYHEPVSDCICGVCDGDPDCYGPGATCNMDGLCNPFEETCDCPDCKDHPDCP